MRPLLVITPALMNRARAYEIGVSDDTEKLGDTRRDK